MLIPKLAAVMTSPFAAKGATVIASVMIMTTPAKQDFSRVTLDRRAALKVSQLWQWPDLSLELTQNAVLSDFA